MSSHALITRGMVSVMEDATGEIVTLATDSDLASPATKVLGDFDRFYVNDILSALHAYLESNLADSPISRGTVSLVLSSEGDIVLALGSNLNDPETEILASFATSAVADVVAALTAYPSKRATRSR